MAKSNKKQIGRSLFNLRKNKGSVLFLVVAIMSVMVILASALYYSLSTARRQVEVKYDSQQAYQSALALNDLVVNYINIKNDDAFVQSIIDLNQNESLVTKSDDGSGFSELAGGLGNYKVTVNKIQGDAKDEIHVLEIEVSIDVNGENSTISTIGEFKVKSKPYNFDRFFTSTGYAPNDVIFKNMNSENETIYLDNEYTQFGGGTAHNVKTLGSEIITAGTIRFESPSMVQDTELTIGNNCYIYGQQGFSFPIARIGGTVMALSNGGSISGGPMYVLGNLYTPRQSIGTVAYVNGDMYYANGNEPHHMIYVNGDLFLEKDCMPNAGRFVVGGNIYCYGDDTKAKTYASMCKGKVYNLKSGKIVASGGVAAANGSEEPIAGGAFNSTQVEAYLKFDLSNSANCNSDEQIRDGLDYVETHCGTTGGLWANVWPSLNGSCEDIATVKQRINEKIGNPEYINWDLEAKFYTIGFENGAPTKVMKPGVKEINLDFSKYDHNHNPGQYVETAVKATTANDYYIFKGLKGGCSKCPIVIDTFMGDYNKVSEVTDKTKYANVYIYLEPNCYVEDGEIKTDTQNGTKKYDCFSWDPAGNVRFVFVRGMGSVTFVVPEGVKYIQPVNAFVGHMAIFNEIEKDMVKVEYANGQFSYKSEQQNMSNGSISVMKALTETNAHGVKNLIKQSLISKYSDVTNDFNHAWYIHNNVFFAAISKNAEMDFSGGKNMYAGFVYAPYMTYNSEGIYEMANNSMFGGMIVSDFIQSTDEDFYTCTTPYDYYDRYVNDADSPEDQEETRTRFMEKLMAESGCTQILTSSTTRTWRKFGYN